MPYTSTTPTDPFYKKKEWYRHRGKFLKRNPLCISCGAKAVVADHVVPRSRGGPDYPDDRGLNALCISCHHRRSAMMRANTLTKGCDVDGLPRDTAHHWRAT